MELVSVQIRGYKRFRKESAMNVDGKIIAVIGPNEAGKTSFLRALLRMNGPKPYTNDEHTRGPVEERDTQLTVCYELDDDDRETIRPLPGGRDARTLWLSQDQTGWKRWLDPSLTRDLGPRIAALAHLRRLQKTRWVAALPPDGELVTQLNDVLADLTVEDQTLSDEQIRRLEGMIDLLAEAGLPKTHATLPDRLRRLAVHEKEPPPEDLAVEILEERRPSFLMFDDDERLLDAEYRLGEAPNAALLNVFRLAELDWQQLVTSYRVEDEGRIEALIEQANIKLKEAFGRAWSQKHTPLTVRLRVDSGVLKILVPLYATDYVPVSQRSDGLRQFIALRAFVAAHADANPVLLIDEAERHLHYDAQADLIDVLTEQTDAAKIIYTTHSAGCLPKDLGTSIRAIVPIEGTDYSRIDNWFWTQGVGFGPVLIGMGASALAFASARKAVITEGITDAMLLPSLIREVTALDVLDYQVAPGLSNASKAAMDELDLTASRVAYLVDSDAGGVALRKELLTRKVPERLIIKLGTSKHPNLTLEDLIDEELFLEVINAELRRHTKAQMTRGDLRDSIRWRSVRDWCYSRSPRIAEPAKRTVAQRILESRRERQLVAPAHRATIRRLHREITDILARPIHSDG